MYFSSNTTNGQREIVKHMLGVKEVDKFETYLGLPNTYWSVKIPNFFLLEGQSLEKAARLERENAITGRKRNFNLGPGSVHPNIYDGGFPAPGSALP